MNKLTNVNLKTKTFSEYVRAVSGLFLALKGEPVTELEMKIIYMIKWSFKQEKTEYITKQLRARLSHTLQLKPQTLYNKITDLKRKGLLITTVEGKTTLSPVFKDRTSINVTYNYNDDTKFQNSIT